MPAPPRQSDQYLDRDFRRCYSPSKRATNAIMVRKLRPQTTVNDLFHCFSKVGPIRNIVIPVSRGIYHGYAFIDFFDECHIDDAIRVMNGRQLDASTVAVTWAERWTPYNIKPRDIVKSFKSPYDQEVALGTGSAYDRRRTRSPSPYIRRPRNVISSSNSERRYSQRRDTKRTRLSPYSRGGISSPYSRSIYSDSGYRMN